VGRILNWISVAGVVKSLLGKLTNKGHTIYIDCFYTGVHLAEELPAVGTVIKFRK
jgi:hypothetical protein